MFCRLSYHALPRTFALSAALVPARPKAGQFTLPWFLICGNDDRSAGLPESRRQLFHRGRSNCRMIEQTEDDGFEVIRDERAQSCLQWRYLAGFEIRIDDDLCALNPGLSLNFLCVTAKHNDKHSSPASRCV
jgi:hypothetical protein